MTPLAALVASRKATLRRLRVVIVLAFAIPLIGLLITAGLMYQQAFEQAREDLDAAARIAQEHASKMLETNEMLLERMLDLLGTGTDAEWLARGAELHERLKLMTRNLPQVQGLFTIGADGRMIGTNRAYPPPRHIDFSDREFLEAHRSGKGSRVFLTGYLVSRVTGESFFDMSRRRELADGAYAGTVNVALSPEYLTRFWAEMASSMHGLRLAALRADGVLIARYPDGIPESPGIAAEHPLMHQVRAGAVAGWWEGISPFDRVKRYGAFRRLGDYPVYVVTAFTASEVLAAWARRVALLALFVVPLACALAALAAHALRRTREELDVVERLEGETARRQRSELALAQTQKLETVGQLAGGVAHDFNNLLMIVAANLHLLRARMPRDVERQIAAMDRAVVSGTRLTRQLLALSGRQALAPEPVLLQERLPGLLALVRAALPGSIDLDAHVAPDTCAIFVDVAELELALINLAINARDAMAGGGRLVVAARNAGEQVVIEVSDTGQGIDPAMVDRVLDPFFTTKPVGKGTGLGLTQVQALCRNAGGKVEIDSSPGAGTRVRLYFARAAAGQGVERQASAAARAAPLDCELLLVEDNDALAQATASVLESLGCRVQRVANARAALVAVDERPLDVVLSDIEMPGRIDGIELALQLGRREPPLPVVLMSGYAARIEQATAAGLHVLSKPCSPTTLRDAISTALAERRRAAA